MTMDNDQHIQKLVEEHRQLAASRGFTVSYQQEQESQENKICFKELAPATREKYGRAVQNWTVWRLSRNEPKDKNFSKDEPDPTPQVLKSFAESYVATRKRTPSSKSTCHNLTSFTASWERETSRTLPLGVKKDVLNFIRTVLKSKYGLPTAPRKRSLVTAKDIDYLLRHLFEEDDHDYIHERARVQTGSGLSLFGGSGARAGAIVESSSYRNTNECLYYGHLTFNIKWSNNGQIKRWVTIDPEFLKGWRYRDDGATPKGWLPEHPILGKNFIFWVIVHGIADGAFKGISTVDKLLARRPPPGRESFTFQWTERAQRLPFYRMVTPQGPREDKALTFSSLHNNFTNLAEREGFEECLRVHGIRGGVANKIDPKASEATRSQALDHENPDTYTKYQSQLKALDVQALFYDLEPDYECRDMEQSMSHHRDPNAPHQLNAAGVAEFECDEEVMALNARISELTRQIAGDPDSHRDLTRERCRLYSRKAKKLQQKRAEYVKEWWNTSYDEYIAGGQLTERDTTCLFDIYKKYMPERSRLRETLFQKVSVDSDEGKACIKDMVALCTSTERVAYYPGLAPVDGKCPECSRQMSSFSMQDRAKHILQCRRKTLNAAPYQQCYTNGKRAHRRVNRAFAQFCYLCAQFSYNEEDWNQHCQFHLENLHTRCGLLTFRYTLVAAGYCPFCLGDKEKSPAQRFNQWLTKSTLLNHIDQHMQEQQGQAFVLCPHPCCENKQYAGIAGLRRHFFDVHSLAEPRSNCVSRKRRWPFKDDDSHLPPLKQQQHSSPDSDTLNLG